jgi:hypothetical protein
MNGAAPLEAGRLQGPVNKLFLQRVATMAATRAAVLDKSARLIKTMIGLHSLPSGAPRAMRWREWSKSAAGG